MMHESGEMYLETILLLKKQNGNVRSIDIARELGFSKTSVSRGVGILKNDGYIIVDSKGIASNDLSLQQKALDIMKNLHIEIK